MIKRFLLLFSILKVCSMKNGNYIDKKYCIIGAGPAGLQMGYYLEQKQRDYIIFEKGSNVGTFFETFPRHGKLISINKRYTGQTNEEFNLRHDWNSLLTEDLSTLFKNFSTDFFPNKKQLLEYLNYYQTHWKIKVQFNTNIYNIKQLPDKRFSMMDQKDHKYRCHLLIVATGLSSPNIPDVSGIELTTGYENMNLSLDHYEGKDVLILGKGNSGFEVAQAIYGVTNQISMASNSQVRLAWATHYVGDLRAVNNVLLDTYQLKSLDGLIEIELHPNIVQFEKCNKTNKINLLLRSKDSNEFLKYEKNFDIVIRCTGFMFDWNIFDKKNLPEASIIRHRKKYPKLQADYNSVDYDNLYFAGTVTHSIDFAKSAGGFIHGFRYTARSLHRIMENRHHGNIWPHSSNSINKIVDHFIRRINEGSGTYQMFSNLADIAIISQDGKSYTFIEEYPILRLVDLELNTGIQVTSTVIVFVFEYGREFSKVGGNPFHEGRARGIPLAAHLSNFLHPVIYAYNKLPTSDQMKSRGEKDILPKPNYLHHIKEDFHTNWRTRDEVVYPFQRFMEYVLQDDFSSYSAETCLSLIFSQEFVPMNCNIEHTIILSK